MNAPVVKAEVLIRRSPAEVLNALVDPTVAAHFWFTKSSGKLVLCAAKAWLEHMIELNAVADKAPDHNVPGWET